MQSRLAARLVALSAATVLLGMCGTQSTPSGKGSGGSPATGGTTTGGIKTGGAITGGTTTGAITTGGTDSKDGAVRDPAMEDSASGVGGIVVDASAVIDGKLSPEVLGSGGVTTSGTMGAGGKTTVVAAPGTTLVKVDANTKHQRFEGWGTSLAWWAHQIGGWSSDNRNQLLDLIVDPVAGLGYTIFRYNIGGGEAPGHSHMTANRQMPGFQASNGTWDWNADARQTSVLSRLVSTGKDVIVEAFSNSPPYWMTKSGCASGSGDGSNNLKDDAYDSFATYLVAVVKHYQTLGITFRTLEPLNEPNANWWKANGTQEGCHFGASGQQQIIKAVSSALAAKGITETRVSASDENSMDDALAILSGYDTASMAAIAQLNAHSYAGSKRTQLRTLAMSKGKRLWQSESGPLGVTLTNNTDSAIFMAGRIIEDLRELQPEAWIEWQVVDSSNTWTSFTVNDAQQTYMPLKRFYMQAGFTRFIRPGATFIDINHPDMIAATSADGTPLAIVVRNGDATASKGFTFDLTSLASVGATVAAHRTSATEDLVKLQAATVKSWSFPATVPAYSVTTFVVSLTQ